MEADHVGNVLVIMAHPDDAELWAGGTIILHSQLAHSTILVSSREANRLAEAKIGAAIMNADLVQIEELTIASCTDVIKSIKPEIVITHPLHDVHPDHRKAFDVVMGAIPDSVISTGYPRKLYTCDAYESLTINGPINGQIIVDVSSVFELKMNALSAHLSQPLEHFGGMARRLGALWGGRIGVQWAEAFSPVPILGRLPGYKHL